MSNENATDVEENPDAVWSSADIMLAKGHIRGQPGHEMVDWKQEVTDFVYICQSVEQNVVHSQQHLKELGTVR